MKISKKTAVFLGEAFAAEVHKYVDSSMRGTILILRDNIADSLHYESRQAFIQSFRQTLDKIEPIVLIPARNACHASQH